jgi:hypothetical protein
MTNRKKLVTVAVVLAVAVVTALIIPPLLRRAARGEALTDYFRRHGPPVASATDCRVLPLSGRLVSIRLDGVRVYTNSTPLESLSGKLLVYPDSERAIQHFGYLPSEQPIRGVRSVHYSRRRLFLSEKVTLVRVDASGRVADVQLRSYDTFTIYE